MIAQDHGWFAIQLMIVSYKGFEMIVSNSRLSPTGDRT